jgi:hypothetical protein
MLSDSTGAKRSRSIDKMKEYCNKIIKSAPLGATVTFYKVSSSIVKEYMLQIMINPVNQNGVYLEKKRINTECQKIGQLLEAEAKTAEANTCLLTSILHAYELIRQQSEKTGKSFRLVILSDMFEECKESPIEGKPIYMNKKEGQPLLSAATKKLIDGYAPEVQLGRYPVELELLVLSNHMKPTIRQQIDETWRMILGKKLGYGKALDKQRALLKDDYYHEVRAFLR